MPQDLPPSYESIVNEVKALPADAKLDVIKPILDKVERLSKEEIDVLVEQSVDKTLPKMEQEDLRRRLSSFMATKTGLEVVIYAARNASASVKKIDDMLAELLAELASVEARYPDAKFTDEFKKFIKIYQDTVIESKLLAARIAGYGKSFHNIVKKVVNDAGTDVEAKKKFLRDFIAKAKDHEESGVRTQQALSQLIVEFIPFMEKFKAWGAGPDDELTKKVAALETEVARLSAEAANLRKQGEDAVNGGIAGGICLGMICVFCPAALPFVLIGAGISMTAGLSVALAMELAAKDKDKELEGKRAELQQETNKLHQLRNVRARLANLVEKDLAIFKTGIGLLHQVWSNVALDAAQILQYLETGVEGVEMPITVKLALDESDLTYIVMARYLEEYALGLSSIGS